VAFSIDWFQFLREEGIFDTFRDINSNLDLVVYAMGKKGEYAISKYLSDTIIKFVLEWNETVIVGFKISYNELGLSRRKYTYK